MNSIIFNFLIFFKIFVVFVVIFAFDLVAEIVVTPDPNLSANVAGISFLTYEMHQDSISLSHANSNSPYKLLSVKLNNNNSRGFHLEFSAENGKCIRKLDSDYTASYANDTWKGNFIDYSVSFDIGDSGYLGFQDSLLQAVLPYGVLSYQYGQGWGTLDNAITMFFVNTDTVGKIRAASVAAEIELYIKMSYENTKHRGVFSDILTCTLIDDI